MILAAAVLTAAISLEIDLGALISAHRVKSPTVTCGIRTVGYRFTGKPGQTFRYAGDTYAIPEEGWVELIADRRKTTYRVDNRSVSIAEAPLNQFGFGEVELPNPQAATTQKESTR
jgi:hypothetical protein